MDNSVTTALLKTKVDSKYKLVMVASKRAHELALKESKEKNLQKESIDNINEVVEVDPIGYLSESEKNNLKAHKPIVVALKEIITGEVVFQDVVGDEDEEESIN